MAITWQQGLLAAAAVAATVMSAGAAAPAAGAAAGGAAAGGAAAGGAAAGTAAAGTAATGAAAGATAAGATTAGTTAGMTAAEIAAAETAATAAAAEGATAGVSAAEGAAAAEAAQAGTTASEVAQTSQVTNIGYGSETGYSSAFQPNGATPTPTGNEGVLSNTMGDATALPETGNIAAETGTKEISTQGSRGLEQAMKASEQPTVRVNVDAGNLSGDTVTKAGDLAPVDELAGGTTPSGAQEAAGDAVEHSLFETGDGDAEKYAKLAASLKSVVPQKQGDTKQVSARPSGAMKSKISGPLDEQIARNRQQLYGGQWSRKTRKY